VNANGISGRVINRWQWEGYLRWRSPQLKLFVGGRAQAVYPALAYQRYLDLLEKPGPLPWVAGLNAHLVAGPPWDAFGEYMDHLLYGAGAHWVTIYCDEYSTLLADTQAPETRALIEATRAGTLRYPSEGIRQVSQAMFLASPAAEVPPSSAIPAIQRAALAYRAPALYQAYVRVVHAGLINVNDVIRYLESERVRLAGLPEVNGTAVQALGCRTAVYNILSHHHKSPNAAGSSGLQLHPIDA